TDLELSSVRLNAATEEMSGLDAPSRIPTPMPARPMTARVPATTWRCLMRSSSTGGLSTATSKASPASIFAFTSGLTWNSTLTLCPLARWKRAANSAIAALAPLPLRTLISAAIERLVSDNKQQRSDQRENRLHHGILLGKEPAVRSFSGRFLKIAPVVILLYIVAHRQLEAEARAQIDDAVEPGNVERAGRGLFNALRGALRA